MKAALLAAGFFAIALTAAAQTTPHDPVIVVPTGDVHAQLDKLAADARTKGSSGATLEDYGTYKIQLSVRIGQRRSRSPRPLG